MTTPDTSEKVESDNITTDPEQHSLTWVGRAFGEAVVAKCREVVGGGASTVSSEILVQARNAAAQEREVDDIGMIGTPDCDCC